MQKFFYKNFRKKDQKPQGKMFQKKQFRNFQVKQSQNGSYQVYLNGTFQVKKGQAYHKDKGELQTIVYLANQKSKQNKHHLKQRFGLAYFPSIQFVLGKCKVQQEKCTICLCQYQVKEGNQLLKQLLQQNKDDIYMLPCSHKFHMECLGNLIGEKKWAKCPICSTIFGTMTGDQPEGQMGVSINHNITLAGHEKGAIIICYNLKSGNRNGVHFTGTSRTAYLPNNQQGKVVLELFKQAFARKLMFTVGRSVTSGLDNQTVWNGIHHKTSTSGGVASFGYPDPTYLQRVKQQLAAKGITIQSIRKK